VLNVTGDHSPPARNRIKAAQANESCAFTFGDMATQTIQIGGGFGKSGLPVEPVPETDTKESEKTTKGGGK